MKTKFYYLLLIIFLVSCTIQKRLYRKGFYIEKNKFIHSKNIITKNNVTHQKESQQNTLISISFPDTTSLSPKKFNISTYPHLSLSASAKKTNGYLPTRTSSFQIKKNPHSNFIRINSGVHSKPIDPVLKTQYISIIFYLYFFMIAVNFYNFFYLDPFLWISSFGGGFLIFFITIMSLIMIIAYFNEKKRNYKAYNFYMSKIFTLINMFLLGFLMHIFILFNSEAIYSGMDELPYSVNFFWINIIISTLLLLAAIYILYFTNKKDKLSEESEIVEEDVNKNTDLKKKVQRLRRIKMGILLLSFLLTAIAVGVSIFFNNVR